MRIWVIFLPTGASREEDLSRTIPVGFQRRKFRRRREKACLINGLDGHSSPLLGTNGLIFQNNTIAI